MLHHIGGGGSYTSHRGSDDAHAGYDGHRAQQSGDADVLKAHEPDHAVRVQCGDVHWQHALQPQLLDFLRQHHADLQHGQPAVQHGLHGGGVAERHGSGGESSGRAVFGDVHDGAATGGRAPHGRLLPARRGRHGDFPEFGHHFLRERAVEHSHRAGGDQSLRERRPDARQRHLPERQSGGGFPALHSAVSRGPHSGVVHQRGVGCGRQFTLRLHEQLHGRAGRQFDAARAAFHFARAEQRECAADDGGGPAVQQAAGRRHHHECELLHSAERHDAGGRALPDDE